MYRSTQFLILSLVLVFSVDGYAGICSILLNPKPYRERATTQIHYSDYDIYIEPLILNEDKDWIEEVIGKASLIVGPYFPASQINVRINESLSKTFFHLGILNLGRDFVKRRMSAPLLHEFGHVAFDERLMKESQLMHLLELLENDRGEFLSSPSPRLIDKFEHLSPTSISLKLLIRLYVLTVPYQELFADLLAVLESEDENILIPTMHVFFNDTSATRRIYKDPSITFTEIAASRSFASHYPIEDFEILEVRKDKKQRWICPSHNVLLRARGVIWDEIMSKTATHSTAKKAAILDLIYRVSRDEVFYRAKRPWLWKLTPQQMSKRFVDRLRAELAISSWPN